MKQFYDNLTQRQLTHLIFGCLVVVTALIILGIVFIPKFIAILFTLILLVLCGAAILAFFYTIALTIAENLKQ